MQHAALDQHVIYWSLDVTVFSARCRLRPASQSVSRSNDAYTRPLRDVTAENQSLVTGCTHGLRRNKMAQV